MQVKETVPPPLIVPPPLWSIVFQKLSLSLSLPVQAECTKERLRGQTRHHQKKKFQIKKAVHNIATTHKNIISLLPPSPPPYPPALPQPTKQQKQPRQELESLAGGDVLVVLGLSLVSKETSVKRDLLVSKETYLASSLKVL